MTASTPTSTPAPSTAPTWSTSWPGARSRAGEAELSRYPTKPAGSAPTSWPRPWWMRRAEGRCASLTSRNGHLYRDDPWRIPMPLPASVERYPRAARPRPITSPTAASRPRCYLALQLGRPLFLEGEAGVGKTEIAKVLATALKRPADPPAMLRGARRRLGGLRVELRPPDDRDPPGRGAASRTAARSRATSSPSAS